MLKIQNNVYPIFMSNLDEHNALIIVKEKACLNNLDNPTCLDLFITTILYLNKKQ